MDVNAIITPKKRGRRPNKIINNVTKDISIAENTNSRHSAVICRMPFNPTTQIKGLPIVTAKFDTNITDTNEGMFGNDIPRDDNSCAKCQKYEKMVKSLRNRLEKHEKEDVDKCVKLHTSNLNLVSHLTNQSITIDVTHIKCWWDCCRFSGLPCYLPESFSEDTYYVIGCFCSFNCMLAYNLYYLKDTKIYYRKSLIYKLYRQVYGLNYDINVTIKEALPRELLVDFGGNMSIEEYRQNFDLLNKEYVAYAPPIIPINTCIEEKTVNVMDNNTDLILKRAKPPVKKKSAIITVENY